MQVLWIFFYIEPSIRFPKSKFKQEDYFVTILSQGLSLSYPSFLIKETEVSFSSKGASFAREIYS